MIILPHLAAQGEHDNALELVVAADEDVNAKNKIGCTPLHYAAMSGITLLGGGHQRHSQDTNTDVLQ